jgi:hypothetical protein
MTLATDTLWFEVAVISTFVAVGHIYLGHFEERTPKLRKLVKLALAIICSVTISYSFGRTAFYAALGICLAAVAAVHLWWLPKHGINGLTGEPREKYYKLRGWTVDNQSEPPA